MSDLRCKHCGSDKGFREYGRATCTADRRSRKIERDPNGKIKVTWDLVEVDDFDSDFDPDGVDCRNCNAEAATVADLVGPLTHFEPGDAVVLPDGLRAVAATVDDDDRTLTVIDWHETFEFGEVSPLVAA